jgi:hypothetical protein
MGGETRGGKQQNEAQEAPQADISVQKIESGFWEEGPEDGGIRRAPSLRRWRLGAWALQLVTALQEKTRGRQLSPSLA